MANLRITQTGSPIGGTANQRASLRSLGLKRLHHTVVRSDDAVTRGMVDTVRHLVRVESTEEEVTRRARA